MSLLARYLNADIRETLQTKMAFIGGPRQVGKTSLALSLLGAPVTESHPAYLNWDDPKVPPRLRRAELPPGEDLVILDEVHKYARWRNLVKGIYDTERSRRRIVVTGSARLDHYRKGGDALTGRYRYYRLHPFSLNELLANGEDEATALANLARFGGFPEPLLAQSERSLRRWQRERMSQVLREDLRIDHKTVERWLTILENLYVCFRIPPFGGKRIRAVTKAQKLYLWDWSMTPPGESRFENLVAAQLLKYCLWQEDVYGHRMELRYLRDTDKREVDFVVLQDRKPVFAVECKTGEKSLSPALRYFAERTSIPRFYQVHLGTAQYQKGDLVVLPFARFCAELKLP